MTSVVLTFDIEDNFEPFELRNASEWSNYEEQVVANTKKILSVLRVHRANATFFILGKVAERRPEVVRTIYSAGHEIASHGYSHLPVEKLGRIGFERDLLQSKEILERIVPCKVMGYRARSFSIPSLNHWAFEIMSQNGFIYDSSVLSSRLSPEMANSSVIMLQDNFYEVCPTSRRYINRHITIGGGLFFRITPLFLSLFVGKNTDRFITYAHAWEFDRNQPKRSVTLAQAFSQAPCFFSTPNKTRELCRRMPCTSIMQTLQVA